MRESKSEKRSERSYALSQHLIGMTYVELPLLLFLYALFLPIVKLLVELLLLLLSFTRVLADRSTTLRRFLRLWFSFHQVERLRRRVGQREEQEVADQVIKR